MIRPKFFILTFVSIFLSISIIAQKVTVHVFTEHKMAPVKSDTIYYDFNRKLTWKDFQGTAPPNVPWGAITASGFSFDSELKEDGNNIEITVGVYIFFLKHDSWKKARINSAYQLEHEQHHFDITRLYAQQLVEEIKKAHFTINNYKKLLNSIFDKVYDEDSAMQYQYDNETNHSMNVEKQKEWNQKISDEIEKLKTEQ
ncbi:MAG TPA: hypothetical protein VMU83_14765 [Hanamia sp.]|nr:hypothetical protein [Hanamia sp.]